MLNCEQKYSVFELQVVEFKIVNNGIRCASYNILQVS